MAENKMNLFSRSSGCQMSGSKVLQSSTVSRGSGQKTLFGSCSFWCLPRIPRHVAASLPFFYTDTCLGIQDLPRNTRLSPHCRILNLITFARYFLNKLTFTSFRNQTAYLLWDHFLAHHHIHEEYWSVIYIYLYFLY